MSKCPICLKDHNKTMVFNNYHRSCISNLFEKASISPYLNFSRKDFVTQKAQVAQKGMSISGVQIKLGAHIEENTLQTTSQNSTFILKPSPEQYPELAENEHLTMLLCKEFGMITPPLGLVEFSDNEKVYCIKRFDRKGAKKLHQEDFTQILSIAKDEVGKFKYEGASYEEVGKFIYKNLDLINTILYFERVFFAFMIGNDDFHLKNISLIQDETGNYSISPVYDFVNSEAYKITRESFDGEMALELLDEFSESFEGIGFYTKADFDLLAKSLKINTKARDMVYNKYFKKEETFKEMIDSSFLTEEMKERYHLVLKDKKKRFLTGEN